ncbi:MAG: hypothetical protein JOZ54_25800 [Acidobacteria bacterium]|nr:hypothetical protein [Acidobacteriota bacterium]
MKATIALLLVSLPLFGQTFTVGPEAWGADPTLTFAEARKVSAASAVSGILVAWQPLQRQAIYVQLAFESGNTNGGSGIPVVATPEERYLGNVASNGREWIVTWASEGKIWTAWIADGRLQATHAVGMTNDIAHASPRVASNGSGYYLTWIDAGKLLGIRLDDFGNNSITPTPRTLLANAETLATASNRLDYLVTASSGGALYAIAVSGIGEVGTPMKLADSVLGDPVLSWDNISYVAFWRDANGVWARAVQPDGSPRGERKPVTSEPMTPLGATRDMLLLREGDALYTANLTFGGVRVGDLEYERDVPSGVATIVPNTQNKYLVLALPTLVGASGFGDIKLAGATTAQHSVDIVPAGNGTYLMSWIEENGELRISRIINGIYANGRGYTIAPNVTRYAIASNGVDTSIAVEDDIQDLVWSGTQFVKITGATTARAATTRSGYVVVRDGVATAYAPDGTQRSSTPIAHAGELLDVASDGDARVLVLFRHATLVLDANAAILRPLEALELDARRVGWTGQSFLATHGNVAAHFTRDGQLLDTVTLFPTNIPPSETAVTAGALGYLRSMSEYHFGDVEHVMFRTLREETFRRRAAR